MWKFGMEDDYGNEGFSRRKRECEE